MSNEAIIFDTKFKYDRCIRNTELSVIMTEKIQKLFALNQAILDEQKFIEEDLDYRILQMYIPFLERVDELSSSLVTIFDLCKRDHVYISKKYSPLFARAVENSLPGSGNPVSHIHPDDIEMMVEAGTYFLRYGFSVSSEKRKEAKLVMEYRIFAGDGSIVRVIEQQSCLEMDRHGNVWLALSILDISPDQKSDNPVRANLINHLTGEVFSFPPPDKAAMLTAREKEILQLISKGNISKEIADKLFISINTVNTHRQRIIEKLDVSNSHEAIAYARKIGLI